MKFSDHTTTKIVCHTHSNTTFYTLWNETICIRHVTHLISNVLPNFISFGKSVYANRIYSNSYWAVDSMLMVKSIKNIDLRWIWSVLVSKQWQHFSKHQPINSFNHFSHIICICSWCVIILCCIWIWNVKQIMSYITNTR